VKREREICLDQYLSRDLWQQIDTNLLKQVNALGGRSPFLDNDMIWTSSSTTWAVAGIIVVSLAIKSRRAPLLSIIVLGIIALSIADLVSFEVVKPFVARERPCWTVDDIKKILGYCGGSYGFTSNHAANAAAFVTVIVSSHQFNRLVQIMVVCVALLIGFSRVYLGVHYPGDVIGGFILGFVIAVLLTLVKGRYLSDWTAHMIIRSIQKIETICKKLIIKGLR
jgi:undecaprenyl-diphosphatase